MRAVHIADGDKVEAGQVLIELDSTDPIADRTRFANMLVQARLDQARLKALLDPVKGDAFAGEGAPDDLLRAARARVEAEEREQEAKLAKLDHEMAPKRAERAQIEVQIAKIDASLPLVRERAAIRAEGLKSGYGNKLDLLTKNSKWWNRSTSTSRCSGGTTRTMPRWQNWRHCASKPRPSSAAMR